MNTNSGGLSCSLGCWLLGAGVGLLTTILLLVLGNVGWVGSIFLGGIAAVLLGLLFNWLFCAPLPKLGEVKPGEAYGMRATPHGASGHAAAGTAAAAGGAAAAARGTSGSDASASGSAPSAGSAGAATEKSAASTASASAAAATGAAATSAGATVKPTSDLKGEAELASRKGDWKYEAGDEEAAKSDSSPSASDAAGGSDAGAADGIDRDGDGVVEGTNEGRRPEALSGPRGGTADDLKRIKGIGPKLEQLCFKLGFYHFDQIAAWKADEVAWVDANLEGFKGRVTRDEWVAQAKLLATGAETEFSKRVDDGDVY